MVPQLLTNKFDEYRKIINKNKEIFITGTTTEEIDILFRDVPNRDKKFELSILDKKQIIITKVSQETRERLQKKESDRVRLLFLNLDKLD